MKTEAEIRKQFRGLTRFLGSDPFDTDNDRKLTLRAIRKALKWVLGEE